MKKDPNDGSSIRSLKALALSGLFFSCGVKGKPMPPLEPPMIGQGVSAGPQKPMTEEKNKPPQTNVKKNEKSR